MSLIHRRKSTIFSNLKTPAQKLKIQTIVQNHKQKLNMKNQSKSKPKIDRTQKLNLKQAVQLQQLYQNMRTNRKFSLNSLFNGFDRNCQLGIVHDQVGRIDSNKMDLFRNGVYYRSQSRAKGAGVRGCDREGLREYFDYCDDSGFGVQKKMKKSLLVSSKMKQIDYVSTNATSFKSKPFL